MLRAFTLLHFIIVVSVFNCIVWEIDCLFLNVCYGENKEMNIKISALLFPLIILSIIILYFLYETINYLKEIPIKICIIIYALISAFFVGLGIASLVIGLKHQYKMEDNLTEYEKNYYENITFFLLNHGLFHVPIFPRHFQIHHNHHMQ